MKRIRIRGFHRCRILIRGIIIRILSPELIFLREPIHSIKKGISSLTDILDGHNLSGDLGGLGDLLLGSVSLLGLLGVQGEEDELALVLLQTLGVELQRLNTLVPGISVRFKEATNRILQQLLLSAVIHGNANGLGVLLAETSSLQLLQGESLAGPDLDVVLVGGAVDSGPQLAQGPGSDAGSLGHTGLVTAELPGGLVEPGLDIILPVLMEMSVRDELVPF